MKVQEPRPGMLCQSTQGRDKGSYYIIMAVEGAAVLVSDGRLKTVACPKKKNLKHVNLRPAVAEGIAGKIAEGKPVYDHDVKAAIKGLTEEYRGT
ncbi:MAG: KOW domain-containing RNA-binding protein [Clostridia bacterium]|nr:KOW domain-containing RNA-binding protein [Clostridia bacterium]